MAIPVLHVDIYEEEAGDSYPVVSYSFFGHTRAEAMRYYRSHLHAAVFELPSRRRAHDADEPRET